MFKFLVDKQQNKCVDFESILHFFLYKSNFEFNRFLAFS